MTTKDFILNLDKNFDEKIGIFVHHHGASYNPTVNLSNYKTYIPSALKMVQDLGINNIEVPFTHVSNYDNEFVVIMQYLVDKALELGMTVMVNANGNTNTLSQEEIESDSQKYLEVMTQFIKNNSGRGIIYEGLGEPDGGTWYGQKNWNGYNASFEWSKKLYNAVKQYDPNSAFVGGVMDPTYGATAWRDGRIVGDIYAYHPYLHNIGQKGNTTPESQLLEATYTLGLDGKPFALTEFGISSQTTEQDAEPDWQGMVSQELAGAYIVRQMIIQDYFNAPMQYLFILGYYYDFKRFRMFDLEGNITPTGIAVKNCISELKGYKFSKWTYANEDYDSLYIAKYVSELGKVKYVYWNALNTSVTKTINGNEIAFESYPKYTDNSLEGNISSLLLRTPFGIKTVNTNLLQSGVINEVIPPLYNGMQTNSAYISVNEYGTSKLLNDVIYRGNNKYHEKVNPQKISGMFKNIKMKSPNGTAWIKTIDDNGSVVAIKSKY